MCESELGLQIELQVHVLAAVFRLPPATEPVSRLTTHNIVDRVAVGVSEGIERLRRITYKTLGRILGPPEHAVAFWLAQTASRTCMQELCATD